MNGLSDKSNEGLPEDAIKEAIRADRVNLHTLLPGKIVSFDSDKQTASVLLLIPRSLNGVVLPVSILQDLPVEFPRGGGFSITFPVSIGDPCSVKFCERSIDKWFSTGLPLSPDDTRLHDFSDGIVQMGLHSSLEALTNFDGDNFQIRNTLGTTAISISPSGEIGLVTTAAEIKMENSLASAKITALGQFIASTANGTMTIQPSGIYSFQGVSEELMQIIDAMFDMIHDLEVEHNGGKPLTTGSKTAVNVLRARFSTLRI